MEGDFHGARPWRSPDISLPSLGKIHSATLLPLLAPCPIPAHLQTSSFVNLPADPYFALLAPACVFLLGMVLFACWWLQRRQGKAQYLLWMAAGYVLPAMAVALQSLMNNAQLAQWALLTGVLYLGGAWGIAQGMTLRTTGMPQPWWVGASVGLFCLVSLYYYSRIDEQLWMRVQLLCISLGLMQLLTLRSVLCAVSARDRLESMLRWTYVAFAVYALLRALVVLLIASHQDIETLTRSGYWLITLAGALLFSMWFSLVLLACSVRDMLFTLREERNRDSLTALLNRRAFMESAQTLMADRLSAPWAVVVGDIDHFKRVNDSWGHACGDRVLQNIAHVLVKQVREGDLVARFGGEEFVLLLACVNLQEAQTIVQRIRSDLHANPIVVPDARMRVTVSFGITEVLDLPDLANALHRADLLLYGAKQAGRDCIHVQDMRLQSQDEEIRI
ncbi:GGDEF domain-containing protein [Comamonas aquatilis]